MGACATKLNEENGEVNIETEDQFTSPMSGAVDPTQFEDGAVLEAGQEIGVSDPVPQEFVDTGYDPTGAQGWTQTEAQVTHTEIQPGVYRDNATQEIIYDQGAAPQGAPVESGEYEQAIPRGQDFEYNSAPVQFSTDPMHTVDPMHSYPAAEPLPMHADPQVPQENNLVIGMAVQNPEAPAAPEEPAAAPEEPAEQPAQRKKKKAGSWWSRK